MAGARRPGPVSKIKTAAPLPSPPAVTTPVASPEPYPTNDTPHSPASPTQVSPTVSYPIPNSPPASLTPPYKPDPLMPTYPSSTDPNTAPGGPPTMSATPFTFKPIVPQPTSAGPLPPPYQPTPSPPFQSTQQGPQPTAQPGFAPPYQHPSASAFQPAATSPPHQLPVAPSDSRFTVPMVAPPSGKFIQPTLQPLPAAPLPSQQPLPRAAPKQMHAHLVHPPPPSYGGAHAGPRPQPKPQPAMPHPQQMVLQAPVQVMDGNRCPGNPSGHHHWETSYGAGWILCFCFFPLGVLCCLAMGHDQCDVCGARK